MRSVPAPFLRVLLLLLASVSYAGATSSDGPLPGVESASCDPLLDGKSVRILWYPYSSYIFISHAELEVDGEVWQVMSTPTKRSGGYEVLERAAKGTGKPFVAFHVDLTPEQFQAVQRELRENEGKMTGITTCMGGVCKVINKNSGTLVPWPIRLGPATTALYLSVAKSLGYKRVTRIEWVRGDQGMFDFAKFFMIGGWATYQEYSTWISMKYLLIEGFNYLGEKVGDVLSFLGLGGFLSAKEPAVKPNPLA